MYRFSYVLVAALAFTLSACLSGPEEPEIPLIEDTDFASSLNVDLPAMTVSSTGLYVRDLEEGSGTGTEAAPDDTAAVRYTGWLVDGTEFDSNEDNDDPFLIRLGAGQVIPGFDEGVTGMQVDGRRQIIIPPELGYWSVGTGDIPPYSILVFNIELEDILGEDNEEDTE